MSEGLLFTDKNQKASCQRKDSHDNRRDGDVEEQSDSGENQIDREQEHSEVFGDVHGFFLRQSPSFCTLKIAYCRTSLDLRRDQNRVTSSVQKLFVCWRA